MKNQKKQIIENYLHKILFIEYKKVGKLLILGFFVFFYDFAEKFSFCIIQSHIMAVSSFAS